MEIRTAMIPMTTSSSTRVKAPVCRDRHIPCALSGDCLGIWTSGPLRADVNEHMLAKGIGIASGKVKIFVRMGNAGRENGSIRTTRRISRLLQQFEHFGPD